MIARKRQSKIVFVGNPTIYKEVPILLGNAAVILKNGFRISALVFMRNFLVIAVLMSFCCTTANALSKRSIANYRASIIALNAMIKAEPNDAELYFERALYHKLLGSYHAAAQDLKIVELLKYPHYRFELYSIKGYCDYKDKAWYKAIEDYNFAIEINPNADFCYVNRAAAFMKIKRYKLAIADCHKAIKLNSYAPQAFSLVGECYYRSGQYKYAIRYLTKAIKRNSKDANSFYFRGASYLKLGQKLAGDLDLIKAKRLGYKKKS